MTKKFVYFVGFLLLFAVNIFSQANNKNSNLIARNSSKKCQAFLNGKLLNNPQPIYPNEAKIAGISGKVQVFIEIDENGRVISVKSVVGEGMLKNPTAEAALQAIFSPTLCDGTPTKNVGVITFNFPKITLSAEYFKPANTQDFRDLSEEQNYYEAVSILTEKYRIAFGYVDRKFHGEMPLTRGDFAHYLRKVLEMLERRGKLVQKPIKEIGLFQIYNPHNLPEIEVSPKAPFAESLQILLSKYGINLAEKDGLFADDRPLSRREIIEIWRNIFGEEALPIHFLEIKDSTLEMSRGDFAIYLKETLEVLSYKVLP